MRGVFLQYRRWLSWVRRRSPGHPFRRVPTPTVRRWSSTFLVLVLLTPVVLVSCTQSAFHNALPLAKYHREVVRGEGFKHVTYRLAKAFTAPRVHVYIEGDGEPWWRHGRVRAGDPTASKVLAFDLMRLDANRTVFLGRPCYHGLNTDAPCRPFFWTEGRFAEPVVKSMARALERLVENNDQVVLIGHSGGGALATLLAARVPQVVAVLTIGANLDTDAWTKLHGYLPLKGSLNPINAPSLAPRIMQLHVTGAADDVVPTALAVGYIARHPNAALHTIPGANHWCCWAEHWPAILGLLNERLSRHYPR